jgi:hypothetical protein
MLTAVLTALHARSLAGLRPTRNPAAPPACERAYVDCKSNDGMAVAAWQRQNWPWSKQLKFLNRQVGKKGVSAMGVGGQARRLC